MGYGNNSATRINTIIITTFKVIKLNDGIIVELASVRCSNSDYGIIGLCLARVIVLRVVR